MRVLHLIESLEFGGAEKVVVSLANATAASHPVAVCCVKRTGALAAELLPDVAVHSLDAAEGNHPGLPFRLAALFRRERCDVVHSHNWGVFLEAALASRLAGVRTLVHTVHGPYIQYPATRAAAVKRAFRHGLERLAARRYRRVALVSDAIASYVLGEIRLPREKLVTVHNGIVDAGALPPRRRPGPPTFITTGRLAAVKDHALLLRAFARVVRQAPGCRLRIVGDGPERPALESLAAELGLGPALELLGFRSDVPRLLADADVFVLSSRYEGISMALLEAMQAALPAVCTRVGGIPETVEHGRTGLIVEPADEQGLADAMLRLAGSGELRERMGACARALQQREFSVGVMLDRYLSLYGAPALSATPA